MEKEPNMEWTDDLKALKILIDQRRGCEKYLFSEDDRDAAQLVIYQLDDLIDKRIAALS